MIHTTTIAELQEILSSSRAAGSTIGFVPTMGALHEGHLRLIDVSGSQNDITVCSIFVNPIQFNNPEDLIKYPRTPEEDMEMLAKRGNDMVFIPSVEEIYPGGVTMEYDFGHLDKVMEGKFRPGHFNGVAVVVKRFFDIVMPHRAYFGEKDFQQLAIIKELVRMEELPVGIVPCPTVREPDGLAMSSRNRRLDRKQRKKAPLIYETLKMARDHAGERSPAEIKKMVSEVFAPVKEFRLEYFEIAGADDLLPVDDWGHKPDIVACIAAYLGTVRLIDNIYLFRNFAPLKQ